MPSQEQAATIHLSTTLLPHRSLSPEGFKWLIRGVIAANLVIGLPMYLLGAWPVLGFMGLDVWLLWFLFQRSYFDARRRETLVLDDHDLVIRRISPEGDEIGPSRNIIVAGCSVSPASTRSPAAIAQTSVPGEVTYTRWAPTGSSTTGAVTSVSK